MPNHIATKTINPANGYTMHAAYLEANYVRVTDSYGNIKCLTFDNWTNMVQMAKENGCQATYGE